MKVDRGAMARIGESVPGQEAIWLPISSVELEDGSGDGDVELLFIDAITQKGVNLHLSYIDAQNLTQVLLDHMKVGFIDNE